MQGSFAAVRVASLAALAVIASACTEVVHDENAPSPADLPPGEAGPHPTSASCAMAQSADPSRTVLALVRGADIVFVRADGTQETVFTFEGLAGITSDFPPQIELVAQGDFVGAVGFVDWPAKLSEAVLLRRSGEVVGQGSMSSDAFLGAHLGSDGWLATAVNVAASTFYIDPTGASHMPAGLMAIGAPRPGGLTPVIVDPASTTGVERGWFDPATGAATPLAFASWSSPKPVDSGLVYTTNADDAPRLVRDGGDAVSTVPLPGPFMVSFTAPGGWAMLTTDWVEFLLAAPDGAAPQPVALPTDLGPMGGFIDSWYDGPDVDGLGYALLVSRDAYRGGLHRSADGGVSWELVGAGFTDVFEIAHLARGGTYVTIATGTDGDQTWSAPPAPRDAAGHVGPGVELARPADGVVRVLAGDASDFVLDDAGVCLAYVRGGAWTMTDVVSGFEIDLTDVIDGQERRAVWLMSSPPSAP